MPSTRLLIKKLKIDFTQFSFQESDDFLWSPSNQTVFYVNIEGGYAYLLHELSHGLLGHADYTRDVELLAMERTAWDKALILAKTYNEIIGSDIVEFNLDTYRDWLHSRSTCPNCQATGLQIKKRLYTCPACRHNWRVNDARICALRRYNESIK